MHEQIIFTFFVVLFSAFGTLTATDAPPSPSSGGGNEQVIHSLFAAFNRHDVDGLAALYAPDAYLMSSDFSKPRHGPEGVRQTYSELFSQLPSVHDEVKTLIVKGDEAAVEFISTWGTNGNMLAGRLEIATFFKLRHGKITSDVTYFNVTSK
jgi:ketosteroid isomerase-like protein